MKEHLRLNWPLMIVVFVIVVCTSPLWMTMAQADSSSQYGWLNEEVVQITTTTAGGLGEATGSGDSIAPIRGHIFAIYMDFAAGLPAATDVTLTGTSPDLTVLALTNNMTDTWYYPTVTQTGNTGSSTSTYDRMPMNSKLHIALAQTYPVTGANTLTVTVLWGE